MTKRTCLDLFAGLGGFSLAAHENGVRPIVQVEIIRAMIEAETDFAASYHGQPEGR